MQFRSHLFASALLGLALYPRRPKDAALVTLAGVLIDTDHYLLYASRTGDFSLLGALRYDKRRKGRPPRGDTRPRYGSLRSLAHNAPLTLSLAWGLARLFPAFTPCALGLTLHLALDTPWATMLDYRVWWRSRGLCERCGQRRPDRSVQFITPPRRGGDHWALDNRVLWCGRCAKQVRKAQDEQAEWETATSYSANE